MATANFLYQDDFRLMAGEFSFPVYAVDEDGEEINGDPIDYETDEYSLRLAQEKIDEINASLRFYKLSLRDGYYNGVQICIDLADDAPDDFWIEHYFDFNEYGVNRYILRRMIQAEKKRINNKILPLFKEYGFDEYAISARFSNGETWYNKVA